MNPTIAIGAAFLALAIGIAIGALIKDQRIERLRRRAEDAEHEARARRAALHIAQADADAWRHQARNLELSVALLDFELMRNLPQAPPRLSTVTAEVVHLPAKKAARARAVRK